MAQNLAPSFDPDTDQQREDRRFACLKLALDARYWLGIEDANGVEAAATRFLAFVEGRTGEAS